MEEFKTALYITIAFGGAIVSILGAWFGAKYQTKQNTKEIEEHKKEISDLKEKCGLMIEKEKAFEEFVSKTVFDLEKGYLNITMNDIKEQNNRIINLLTGGK